MAEDTRSPGLAPAPGAAEAGSEIRDEIRFREGEYLPGRATLAREVPVALEYNGTSHAVMLATPADLEDFALGFSLSEGILEGREELYGIDIHPRELATSPAGAVPGVLLALSVSSRAFEALRLRRRTLAGRTGCGLCGTESLDQVIRPLAPLPAPGDPAGLQVVPEAIARAGEELAATQELGARTGAAHAAAWCSPQGEVLLVREDVGRHNALDKLVGAMAGLHGLQGGAIAPGFAFVTSRASVEMVQKAVAARIGILAAVSAPTTLAIDLAHRWGLTLVGFARGEHFSVYTHRSRLMPSADASAALRPPPR